MTIGRTHFLTDSYAILVWSYEETYVYFDSEPFFIPFQLLSPPFLL